MSFKVGDRVIFLYEKGGGTITAVLSAHKIRVELSVGLEIEVPASDIVPLKGMPLPDVPVLPKDSPAGKREKVVSKSHASHTAEVDLHIETLTDDYHLMSNTQKINMQLDCFRNELEKAIRGHIKKIVFIHGVGNGVLRQAIRDVLKRYEGIEYSDGSYSKYGAGATEVRIIARKKAR